MDSIFLQILNMSLTASYVILFVLLARLLLKKAPKIFSYALWAVVLFRLICPFSFESALSLLAVEPTPIPMDIAYTPTPQIDTGINIINNAVNPLLGAQVPSSPSSLAPTPEASSNPLQIWVFIGQLAWLAGIAVLLLYSVISLLRLRSKLVGAVKWQDNIYFADRIPSPFVLGIIRTKIYLPSALPEDEREYIILHEKTHIRRFDHVVKIVWFFALALHWFNPLVWIAYILCVKDMEMSCDESVMKKMGADIRQKYSASLLSLATGRKIITGTPLAFGEGNTKSRIKNVLRWKKPAFWVTVIALVAVAALTIGFASSRPSQKNIEPNISEISLENLNLSANPGVGVRLDYESEDFIVFHGNFGLFGYDLNKREILFSVDFVKAIGIAGSVQGSHGSAVEVSDDGKTIMLYEYDVETETRGEACYIDVPTLTYTLGEYMPMDSVFSHDNAVGYIMTTTVIETLYYARGDKEWLLFENYTASQNEIKLTLYGGVPADPTEAAPIAKNAEGWYPLDDVISAVVSFNGDADITLYFAEAGTEATPIPAPFPIEKNADEHMMRINMSFVFPSGFFGHVWAVATNADGKKHTSDIVNVIYEHYWKPLYYPDVPDIVLAYANEYIAEKIVYYENNLGYKISGGEIINLSRISTGTTGLIHNIEMWRLEYRLLPTDPNAGIPGDDVRMDGDRITEWGSNGQPLLVVVNYIENDSWERVGITGTLTVTEEFNGDYTAATMAMFNAIQTFTDDEVDAARAVVEQYWQAQIDRNDDALWETQTREKTANDVMLSSVDIAIKNVFISYYSQDKMRNDYIKYGRGQVNGTTIENVIVFKVDFEVEHTGQNTGAWNKGQYANWNMILIRDDKNSAWLIDDQGY